MISNTNWSRDRWREDTGKPINEEKLNCAHWKVNLIETPNHVYAKISQPFDPIALE